MTEATVATPNNMPGAVDAAAAVNGSVDSEPVAETVDTQTPADQPVNGLPPDKLAQLNRTLREERNQWRREAREAKELAESLRTQWDEIRSGLGVDDKADFDPRSAIEALQRDIKSERTERLRVEVARVLDVDPKFIIGDTEDTMRESGESYLSDVNARIEAAIRSRGVPAGAPASTVTASTPISGPQQIISREELARMSPAERVQAYKDGRLDSMMGKT